MGRTWGSCTVVICSFLIWFSVIQALETGLRFDRTFLKGASSKPYLKRWGRSTLRECAVVCSRWSECKSFSVRPSLQECSLYSSRITPLDITPASVSDQETFYWKRLDRCPLEEGYASVPGTHKCLRHQEGAQNWTEAEATCEAEGGHLATIEDLATWTAVRAFLEGAEINSMAMYVAATRSSTGQWLWLDGRALKENIWRPGEPGSDYENCSIVFWRARARSFPLLDDVLCNRDFTALCEI